MAKNKKIKNIKFNNTKFICVHGCVENFDDTLDDTIEENYVFMKVMDGDYLSTARQNITQRNTLQQLIDTFPEQSTNESLLQLIENETNKTKL